MTLCIAWIDSRPKNERLIAISDRLVTGGGDLNFVPKIRSFDRPNVLFCWEGETRYILHLLELLADFFKSHPKVCCEQTAAQEIERVVCSTINDFWQRFSNYNKVEEKPPPSDIGSFIFGCFDYSTERIVVRIIVYDYANDQWQSQAPSSLPAASPFKYAYIGSGREFVRRVETYSTISPTSLVAALKDALIKDTSVGGISQVVVLDRRGAIHHGIIKEGKKYVDGIEVSNPEDLSMTIKFLEFDDLSP